MTKLTTESKEARKPQCSKPEKSKVVLTEEKPLPEMKYDKEDGAFRITVDDKETADKALRNLFGTNNKSVQDGGINNLVRLSTFDGEWSKQMQNYATAFMVDLEPRDSIESALAMQMYTVHKEIVMAASRMMQGNISLEKYELYTKVHARLTRIFIKQMEALRKHRNGGEQKVTVQHVNVSEGGQAVVGDVVTGGGKKQK